MKYSFISSLIISLLFLSGCAGSRYGSAIQKENIAMTIRDTPDVINYAMLQAQNIPSLASRGRGSRGGGLVGTMLSLGTTAVKQMIAKEKKKYSADWRQGLTDLYFYDQLSSQGAFDPIGMQFNGFKVVRTFDNNGVRDTALFADFELDTTTPYEIINNSVFRLRLKEFKLNYAKAKVAPSENTLNMDFEITFNASYVNSDGQLFKNAELGKFFLRVRNAPLNKDNSDYTSYYKNMVSPEKNQVEGWSFIVPRSFGYQVSGMNITKPAFSQGAYTIDVKVTESSKNNFVNELIINNSDKMIDFGGKKIETLLNNIGK